MYGLGGLSSTFVDWSAFFVLTRASDFLRVQYLLANVFAFSLGVIWSYFFHRRYTFRVTQGTHGKQFPKFILVALGGLVLNSVALWAGIEILGLYDLVAKIFAIGISVIWNFNAQRLWTFKQNSCDSTLSEQASSPYTEDI